MIYAAGLLVVGVVAMVSFMAGVHQASKHPPQAPVSRGEAHLRSQVRQVQLIGKLAPRGSDPGAKK